MAIPGARGARGGPAARGGCTQRSAVQLTGPVVHACTQLHVATEHRPQGVCQIHTVRHAWVSSHACASVHAPKSKAHTHVSYGRVSEYGGDAAVVAVLLPAASTSLLPPALPLLLLLPPLLPPPRSLPTQPPPPPPLLLPPPLPLGSATDPWVNTRVPRNASCSSLRTELP